MTTGFEIDATVGANNEWLVTRESSIFKRRDSQDSGYDKRRYKMDAVV
jgi:hypothetical protein